MFKRTAIISLLFLCLTAGHVMLAPVTAGWLKGRELAKIAAQKAIEEKKVEEQRVRQFNEFSRLLHAHPPVPNQNFITAATSLRDWLRPAGKDLTVVLLPLREALMQDGALARKAGFASRMMVSTGEALKAENINVVNLLPDVYQAYQRGMDADVFADASGHYAESICDKTVNLTGAKEDAYFVGDCFALLYSRAFEKVNGKKVRYSWVNGMTNMTAHNLSSYGIEELADVKHVFWFIADYYLIGPAKFPACIKKDNGPGQGGISSGVATLIEKSSVKPDLATASPYKDALVVNVFKDREGRKFLGIAHVMKERVMDEIVRIWAENQTFLLVTRDWDEACRENKELRSIQQIDAIQDFNLPRKYIVAWANTVK